MEIRSNTTGLAAGLSAQSDVDGREHCVVAVVGTYHADPDGQLHLAPEQHPPTMCDVHHGDPAQTSVAMEHDFALRKPATDVIVVGKAVAPNGEPVTELPVRLEVDGRSKDLLVIGERRWVRAGLGLRPSAPVPFTEMPLVFDQAYGGPSDLRNPLGVGADPAEGQPLPNIEDPRAQLQGPRSRSAPVGVGCVGRSWDPRRAFAGTYDERWRAERCPFLPEDFDDRYFQCAPLDQQFPHFRGGELIRCVHMAERSVVTYRIPEQAPPVSFDFVAGRVERRAVLDTVILEPHHERVRLVWRASAPLTKKLTDLRGVDVGEQPLPARDGIIGYRRGKPVFPGIAATLRWLAPRRDRPRGGR
ncbi:DUF2169 domain-containing protein [Pseudenhygromyxa sp. WMMC2535]|uniref:DUF2169 family type VI secretion system accessory protein n=1 Tax=Pseudenhygromyxa sp. WMMC2535 TaxID=2712867 RepID=UPI001557712B|nr:DUF2169 domain-containing protein [Pseudenhygromyxa sp. WMMC2535]NVB38569.1 DUF2169 domain-containing protein [Pseudenhygromyxa sp. WMMC2535]